MYGILRWSLLALPASLQCGAATPIEPRSTTDVIYVDLSEHLDNKAFGSKPGEARFDGLNQSYPIVVLGKDGIYTSTHTGIQFQVPEMGASVEADNIVCGSQEISVPSDNYLSASLLISADLRSAIVTGNLTFNYDDGSSTITEMRSQPWWTFLAINRGEITFPYFFTANGTNRNASHIYEYTAALDPTRRLSSMTLPDTTNVTAGRLHVFATSLWKGHEVKIQTVRPTQKWTEDGNQIVEVIANNAGTQCVSGDGMSISLKADGIETTTLGNIKRLCPGDQKSVNLAVRGSFSGTVEAVLSIADGSQSFFIDNVQFGLEDFDTSSSSLLKHETPDWYNEAKFGIFIHYGAYAVIGWGNSTPHESYSEWFWWYTTHEAADRSGFYEYRLRTYGPEWNYDDSFPEYTAEKFEPKEWVDLIADSGAGYFVFTTKHHEGLANFDTGSITNRSTMHYGPLRDILGELFAASTEYQPHLKRGTYFSIPEWFNPDWAPYGFSQFDRNTSTTHPGIIARNPYAGLEEPYTGRIPLLEQGKDFVHDLMRPQMDILAYNYSTDIMWCDAGAANDTDAFAAQWFNTARKNGGRQVVINDRCGSPWAADHDTPEYHSFGTAQRRKWESNRGMDTYSYGYNRATPDEEYMEPKVIVQTLVDIVSKNGNFLLNIGPRADGTIPEIVQKNLRRAGEWIKAHEEAVMGTQWWFWGPELVEGYHEEDEVVGLRFTQTNEAFYVLSLEEPEVGQMLIDAPVPVLEGDKVVALGMRGEEREVQWEAIEGRKGIKIQVTQDVVDADEYCWVFKIEYVA